MAKMFLVLVLGAFLQVSLGAHTFIFKNQCNYAVTPVIVNANCGYSPRCDAPGSGGVPNPAVSYTGPQPRRLSSKTSQTLKINQQWNGRIFNQSGKCGVKGENCTILEFNLDTGDKYTPQAYDISNVQGFTQSVRLEVTGCKTVTCKAIGCGCKNAYPPGDMRGCGNDWPIRGCGTGDKTWMVTFCPS